MSTLYTLILYLVWPLLITTPSFLKSDVNGTLNVISLAQEGVIADTLIKTIHGYKSIASLSIHEQVIGYDKETNQYYPARVTAVTKHITPNVIKITTNTDVIQAGAHQKFYLPEKKDWILAKDIKLGDYLCASPNNSLVIKIEKIDIPTPLYAITVERSHFFITNSDIVVHNFDPGTASTALTLTAGTNPAGITLLGGVFLTSAICFTVYKIWKNEFPIKVFKSKNNVNNNSPCECGCKCFDQSTCSCNYGCVCQPKETSEDKKSDFFTNLKAKSDKKARHSRFGLFYRDSATGLWWSKDTANHGGSKFKVFKEGSKGFNWEFDANASGEKILNKHKGPVGLFIPFKELIML